MTTALATFAIAFVLRVGAKTAERRAANALIRQIFGSGNAEAVTVIRSIVPQPSIGGEIARVVLFERALVRAVYLLFAFSLAPADSRTPNALLLWDARHRLHALRERDTYDRTRGWERTFALDASSAILLAGAIGFVLLRLGTALNA